MRAMSLCLQSRFNGIPITDVDLGDYLAGFQSSAQFFEELTVKQILQTCYPEFLAVEKRWTGTG